MVDPPALRDRPLTDEPLFFQRHFGYFDGTRERSRLIYWHTHGCYHLGRHETDLPAVYSDDVYVLWFGWCPW